jgi:hypothetical protein
MLRRLHGLLSPERAPAARWRAAVLQCQRELARRYPLEYPALQWHMHRKAWAHAH